VLQVDCGESPQMTRAYRTKKRICKKPLARKVIRLSNKKAIPQQLDGNVNQE